MNLPLEARDPVVFFVNGIGDSIINLPALRGLATFFNGRLKLVHEQAEHAFFFDDIPSKRKIAVDVGRKNGIREFDFKSLTDEIGRCDTFVSLVPWVSNSLAELVERLKPDFSIGFFSNYTVQLPLDFSKHSADLAFDLVRHFAPYRLEEFDSYPPLPQSDREKSSEIRRLLRRNNRILAIHTDTCQEKMWDPRHFVTILDTFLDRHREFVVFVVGRIGQSLERCAHADRVIPCYGLPLAESCSLVADADLFLGVDSCMLHLADFSRVPGIGLFGPTRAEEFGFRVGPNITFQADGKMDDIKPWMVDEALESILSDPRQSTLRKVTCDESQVRDDD